MEKLREAMKEELERTKNRIALYNTDLLIHAAVNIAFKADPSFKDAWVAQYKLADQIKAVLLDGSKEVS
jgi:hypothetical protein